MKNVIIVDHDPAFISDLQARLIIDEPEEMNVYISGDSTTCLKMVDNYHPDLVAASSKMLHDNVLTDKCPVVFYAHSKKEKDSYPNPDHDFLGIAPMTSQLLTLIQKYLDDQTSEEIKNDVKRTDNLFTGNPEDNDPVKSCARNRKGSESGTGISNETSASFRENGYYSGLNGNETKGNRKSSFIRHERFDQEAVNQRERTSCELAAKEPARGITVYSAKGGVGKTTIACELASMLACTEHGRSHYKVCIADFNVDFGDVLNQLDFDPKKPCMTHWIADIRTRLTDGEKPDNLNYTPDQISVFLQVKKETGLSALLAPLTNQDSMDIKAAELEIMVRNLIDNGGFDFVIFDTGNNTRDSSYIPMLYSDQVLVVLTQSINTANCCNAFFTTMAKISFDMSKFRLVLNRIQSQKATGLDPEELKEVFRNVKDKDSKIIYSINDCYAQIRESSDVISSGNDGIPLVVKEPTHEFSRGIADIMANITRRNFVLPEPGRKGFFSRLFGIKKGKE